MSREVVPPLPDGVQRHIGSFNRLFPDFHGTVSEMEMLWDGFEARLRELRPEADDGEDPQIDIAKHAVPVSWNADEPAYKKELPVWCSVQLQETDDGVERLAVVVETRHSAVRCAMRKAWSTNLDDPDKLQHFKRSLAAAAKFMADYRPCKGPTQCYHTGWHCGHHCVDGKDHCLRHWIGLPFQAAVDGRAAKRQRTS